MNWFLVGKTDTRARLLADRHYSRQSKGHREFCPPGNSIVLIIPTLDGAAAQALWVSHRPDPKAGIGRRDGFDYWDNPYFRNESGIVSSILIREALAITRFIWGNDVPVDGFHSFVNPAKLEPIMRRGKKMWGYCFWQAGFRPHAELTKERKLIRYMLTRAEMLAIQPLQPQHEQMRLLA